MKRSKHNLSYTKLLTCNMGELVPIGLSEVLPGDSIQMNTTALVRMSPLNAPIMHPVQVRIHHWFVPNRLMWINWEPFITGGPDGTSVPNTPTITWSGDGPAVGGLADHLGLPPGYNGSHSALPVRGYQLIWNEWYRDQDLQTKADIFTGNGNDDVTATALQNVCWEKDYFTSSRPWEQKGPQVSIPIVGDAPVKGIGLTGASGNITTNVTVRETDGSDPTYPYMSALGESGLSWRGETDGPNSSTVRPKIYADLAAVSGVTVNQLRESLAIQRFEEARARYGSRYSEYLRALGVRSSDARLQRPEYLGGGRQTIQFSEVLQTATYDTQPVGQMYGHGISALKSNRFRKFFEEHGLLFTLLSIRPKTIYANGIQRMWHKPTKYDYWQKELEHIGQQEIKNREVFAGDPEPGGTFGYQDRYDEYRRSESGVSGEFRTSVLDFWHLGRLFGSNPALNSSFVSCKPTDRVFAISPDVQASVYVHARHSIGARRLVSPKGNSFTF